MIDIDERFVFFIVVTFIVVMAIGLVAEIYLGGF